ncbi:ABC transporter substrate-binding protein [Streptomyces sp. YC504]|uniref:ABC transporter substrate-binding protein n=1 Tax=Streptomyces mesophilus TaxID=1775132 RepID=A0A6G4XSG7_9ACTN|nr:ABC transporter substrate-binding protein [Streptomyces mesophilus]NGO79551.1 ABC transporter substrate-binding protein [Streptomyces mesophilus]
MRAAAIRGTGALAATAALAVAASACSAPGEGGSGSAGAGDSAVVGIAYEPETLSPLLGYGKDGNSKIFDGLLTHDADMKLEPALAAELPKKSADGLTYTFKLRDGVKFSDGKPFSAKDVVYTYETILDEKTNNAYKSELDALKSVEAKGDDEVVFKLKYPYAPFAERTVQAIAPEHLASKQDVNTGDLTTEPVGTGPYTLVKWSKGEKLTFKANPAYWGGEPKVKNFTMAIIKDDDVRATRLRSGDLDGAILPPNLAKTFAGDKARKTYEATSFDYRVVTLPTGNKVAGDTDIRRALDVAVDRKAMVDAILDGAGKEAYGPVPTDSEWFTKGTERAHDLKQAGKILDEAGWKKGSDGIREKDGVRASFPLWYLSGDKLRQDHALAYASDAKKAGIEIKVQAGTWEVIQPRMDRDAVLAGGGAPADPDFDQYAMLHSKFVGGNDFNNMSFYENPAVDKALEKARETDDHADRKAAYDTVQRELVKNPGYTFLTHIDHVYVVNDHFGQLTTQVEPHDHGFATGPWWNVEDWQPKQ